MATPLRWSNIDVPNTESSLNGIVQAGNAVRDSFKDIGQLFLDNTNRKRTEATDAEVARALMASDLESLAQIRAGMDPSNRMMDNARLAAVLGQRESQIRQDRVADQTYGVTSDQIAGAAARAAGLETRRNTGQGSGAMTGGMADYLYLDANGRAFDGWQGQENKNRNYDLEVNKFDHAKQVDGARLALARQAEARAAAEAADRRAERNQVNNLMQLGSSVAAEVIKSGQFKPDEVGAEVLRRTGGMIKNPAALAALTAGIEMTAGVAGASSPNARMAIGDLTGGDELAAARGMLTRQGAEEAARYSTGLSYVNQAEKFAGKTPAQILKESGIKDMTPARFQSEINRVKALGDKGMSTEEAATIVINSIDTNVVGDVIRALPFGSALLPVGIGEDAARVGVKALRDARDAGGAEGVQRLAANAGDRDVAIAARQLQELEARIKAVASLDPKSDTLADMRQKHYDAVEELRKLLPKGSYKEREKPKRAGMEPVMLNYRPGQFNGLY